MKRLVTVGGLILLVACFCASPAEAVCYNCNYHGYSCGSFGCEEYWRCENASFPCSQCWESCYEVSGLFCNVNNACQFAEKPATQDLHLFERPSTTPLAIPAS